MRVFFSFGYLPEEAWVASQAIPVLESMGIEVVHAQDTGGRPIDAEIRRRVRSSDALVGFLLRRGERTRDGLFEASEYVRQEVEIALGQDKDVVQVVESGVRLPKGFATQYQHLLYRPGRRAELLVDLTRHVRAWCEGEVKVRLQPRELVRALGSEALRNRVQCSYVISHQSRVEREGTAAILAEGGGLFTKLLGFRPGRQAQISVEVGEQRWASSYLTHAQPFADFRLQRL